MHPDLSPLDSSIKVAFQGEHGAYSEEAALSHFGPSIQTVPYPSFDAVFAAVENAGCDLGLIPIENSQAGSIHRNYDLLLRHNLFIIGETYLRVQHCLIGLPGASKAAIREVLSHPQALAQCEQYLSALSLTSTAVYDTAGAVRLLRDRQDPSLAAVASRRAAQVYQMEILDQDIEDSHSNITRFLVISREPEVPLAEAKTSIVFTLDNKPGALFRAMSVFALRDIDLTKIESRPVPGSLWEYLFYIDFAGSSVQQHVKHALENLGEYTLMLRVLGSYPRVRYEQS